VHEYGINPDTNEIYLNSQINGEEEHGIDYRVAANFIRGFNILDSQNNDKPIIVHLNSIGGDVSQGLTIFDVIKQSKRHIYIIGYSEVASMSSVILQAADTRLLAPNSSLMVHNATLTTSECPTHGLKSYLKLLADQEDFMLNLYASKCINGPFFKERNYSLPKVRAYIRGRITQNLDWYMGSEEALSMGFCDGIIGTKEYISLDFLRRS
jgi:ATP-dependent protease ClpP protease subunit